MGGDLLSFLKIDVERFAWPREWGPARHPRAWATMLALAGPVFIAVVLIVTDGLADPKLVVAVAMLPVPAAFAVLAARTMVRRRIRSTASVRSAGPSEPYAPAVVVPYRRDVAALLLVVTVWIALGGLALVIAGALVAATTAPASTGLGAVVLGAVLLAPNLPILIAVLRGRVRSGAVVLSPECLVHRSWTFDIEVRWSEVIAVAPGGEHGNYLLVTVATPSGETADRVTVRSRAWRQSELLVAPHVSIRVSGVAVDPVLLLHTLRFYAEHPEARPELGTTAGVDRIRRGDVWEEIF